MIFPNCKHDKHTMPSGKGWIITCSSHYEAAVRLNLLEHKDATRSLATEGELIEARAQIQKLESDLNDCLAARGISFIRCACGRLKLKPFECRSCGT